MAAVAGSKPHCAASQLLSCSTLGSFFGPLAAAAAGGALGGLGLGLG